MRHLKTQRIGFAVFAQRTRTTARRSGAPAPARPAEERDSIASRVMFWTTANSKNSARWGVRAGGCREATSVRRKAIRSYLKAPAFRCGAVVSPANQTQNRQFPKRCPPTRRPQNRLDEVDGLNRDELTGYRRSKSCVLNMPCSAWRAGEPRCAPASAGNGPMALLLAA